MTTKVKVKKTRAERKQHSRDMQAKHEAEKQRNNLVSAVLDTLGIGNKHAGRSGLSEAIMQCVLNGDSREQIVSVLTSSELMKKAQLAETERQRKIKEQANQQQYGKVTNQTLKKLGITSRHPLRESVRNLARELAEQKFSVDEILTRLKGHETVLESLRLHRAIREDIERQIDEGIAERKKNRVDMREVLAYLAKKNGTTYTAPADYRRSTEQHNSDAPTWHKGKVSESRLTGAESIQKENPRQYGLPNLKTSSASINKAGMSEAIKLVGGRVTEFRTYLYEHRDTGLRADVLARRFMAESMQGNKMVDPVPVNEPDNTPAPTHEPAKRKWTKEEKQEARDRALAAASQAGKLKEAETNGITHDVMRESQPAPQPALISVEVEQSRVSMQEPSVAPLTHPKREGSTTSVVTRPDQADFAATVRRNCKDRCVITGASLRRRTEAAHLVEHSAGGLDHWSNGLLLRIDLHRLFDDNVLASCPETLTVHVDPDAQAEDPDLQQYDGHVITGLCRPIDPANLVMRWERYQRRLELTK
ncbi:TPA: HNH endonuclease [Citrobacter freundii]